MSGQKESEDDDRILSSWDAIDWETCLAEMTRYAQVALQGLPLRTGTASDVAQSALGSRIRKAKESGEPPPATMKELEKILREELKVKIKDRKNEIRRQENRTIRDADSAAGNGALSWVESFAGGQPTPENIDCYVACALECVYRVTNDPNHAKYAELALKGFSVDAIAEQMELSVHQVYRLRRKLLKLFDLDRGEE